MDPHKKIKASGNPRCFLLVLNYLFKIEEKTFQPLIS